MHIEVLGIDLGKADYSRVGSDAICAVAYRKRLQRHRLLDFLEDLTPCINAKEAHDPCIAALAACVVVTLP